MTSNFLVFAPGLSYGLSKHGDDFTPFFRLWKTITKSLGKNWKFWGIVLEPEIWWTSVPSFMEIVQRVKKLNSILRARLNFRRRPIVCTALYRNPMQASNFGGAFDQLFLWICLWNFHKRCLSTSSIPCCKKVKMTKNSNQGGPAWIVCGAPRPTAKRGNSICFACGWANMWTQAAVRTAGHMALGKYTPIHTLALLLSFKRCVWLRLKNSAREIPLGRK